MVSNPPVEVLVAEEEGVALVSLTPPGNDHVDAVPNGEPRTDYHLDEWALRELARQAESAADQLADGEGGEP